MSKREQAKDDVKNLASNVRKMFKPSDQTPAEEAATVASMTNVAATATAVYSIRWQQRLAYAIRWLHALQETAHFAEQAFGQVAEEALLDTAPGAGATTKTVLANLATLYEEPEDGPTFQVGPDFVTDSAGGTEKVAGTEPPPPMNRAQRRAAMQEGRPVGPPAGPPHTPRKDTQYKDKGARKPDQEK